MEPSDLSYVHLHLHSTGSRLDGLVSIPELIDHCVENGMPAVAVTDHGNISQAIELYTEAKSKGVNPLIGLETYLVEDHTQKEGSRWHEGIIASSWEGYQNLVRLSTLGFTEGLRRNYFACIDDEQLERNNQGLIVLSGCISSRLARTLMGGLETKNDLLGRASRAEVYSRDEQAYIQARIAAKNLAMSAAAMTGTKKQKTIQAAQDEHTFLDLISSLLAESALEGYIDNLHLLGNKAWDQAWSTAEKIVENRLRVFGDRYYLETQVIPSDDQQTFNGFVRKLASQYQIKIVQTCDAHYLKREDADLHHEMLRIRTEKHSKKPTREATVVTFPDDQAQAILSCDGEESLKKLFDEISLEQGACLGKKVNLETKAHSERRRKWVQHAQIFYLQNQGDTSGAEALAVGDDNVSLDAVDPGRAYADWAAEFWVRTPAEMIEAGCPPEEMQNTVDLAQRCNIIIPVNDEAINPGQRVIHMPVFPLPSFCQEYGWNHDEYLTHLCQQGLRAYLDLNPALDEKKYIKQLSYELSVITQAGFSNYFLIVRDYIQYARDSGGLLGPARGSSAGSLAAFLLGITRGIDPLKYPDLMFERFLTPGRADLPDIDTDFDFASAERVLAYCQQTYGEDRVCRIGTFSKMGARQAIMDIGRNLGVPYLEVEKVSALLKDFKPDDDQVEEDNKALFDLERVADLIPALGAIRDANPLHKRWFEYAGRLTGKVRRNISQHASGVAIASDRLVDLGVPLMATVATNGERVITTQFGMDDLALMGIPKFDQLKLTNLNVISDAEQLIGDDFSVEEIVLNDEKTFASMAKGDNLGVFQVAQPKVRGVMRDVAPRTLGDIANIITVIRPGLFAIDQESGMTMEELFRARCRGEKPIVAKFPFLEPILKSTKQVLLFQEQASKVLLSCGFDVAKAEKLRKIFSKKKMSEALKFEDDFIQGAQRAQNLSAEEAKELWDTLVEFAGYSFNSAHAYSYGLIAYWTSYLKTHYPAQFLAATLTTQAQKSTKTSKALVPKLLEDCGQMGRDIPILPPSVNYSESAFSLEYRDGKDCIRYGLGGVKGLGTIAQTIIAERVNGKYSNFEDFDSRVTKRQGRRVPKNVLEALALSGALDEFFTHRSEALWEIEMARAATKTKAKELKEAGWTAERRAKLDQSQAELCGNYYFSRDNIDVLGKDVDNFFEKAKGDRVTIGGRVIEAQLDKKSKRGGLYHRILLKTQWGDVSVDFFPGKAADPGKYLFLLKEKLFTGSVIFVTGNVRDDHSLWGNTISLPKAEYRGESKEDPIALAKEAEALLYV